MKEYLNEHSNEFKESISPSAPIKRTCVIEDINKTNKHNVQLLLLWSYQVELLLHQYEFDDLL